MVEKEVIKRSFRYGKGVPSHEIISSNFNSLAEFLRGRQTIEISAHAKSNEIRGYKAGGRPGSRV